MRKDDTLNTENFDSYTNIPNNIRFEGFCPDDITDHPL